MLLRWFGDQWLTGLGVVGSSQSASLLLELYQAWSPPIGLPKGKESWRLSFFAVIWILWKERNSRCFEGRSENCGSLLEKMKFFVASWVIISQHSKGYSEDQIMPKLERSGSLWCSALVRCCFLLVSCFLWYCLVLCCVVFPSLNFKLVSVVKKKKKKRKKKKHCYKKKKNLRVGV